MRIWLNRILTLALLALFFGCGGGGGGSSSAPGSGPGPQPPGAPPVRLVAVEFDPASATLSQGFTLPLRLFALYSNGFRLEVTGQSQLLSNSPAVVLEGSLARAEQVGTATISGRFEGQSATMRIDVTEALLQSLTVDPSSASLPLGTAQQFRALGSFSDGSTRDVTSSASWTSLDSAVAELSPGGSSRARAVGVGQTRIRAELLGQSAEASIEVTAARLENIEVSPSPVAVPVGIVQAFQATGVYSDNSVRDITEEVSWTSSDSDVMVVSDVSGTRGLAVGLLQGSARIRASLGSLSNAAEVTVSPAVLQSLQIEPDTAQVAKGLQQAFIARGRFSDGSVRDLTEQVIWSTSEPSIASISNLLGEQGRATGVNQGTTGVQAELNGIQAEASLEVTPAVLQSLVVSSQETSGLPAGLSRQFLATGHFSDGNSSDLSDQVLWSTSDSALASVDTLGRVTALKPGVVAVRAELGSVAGSTPLTIAEALLESLDIQPLDSELPKGLEQAFTATGHYSDQSSRDLTSAVVWRSSAPAVAAISNAPGNQGRARALSLGVTRISAELDGQQAETGLTVTAAVLRKLLVTPSQQSLPQGFNGQLRAVGVFSDGLQRDITSQASWSSPSPATVGVDAAGKVSALQLGEAEIRAEFQQLEGTATVSVDSIVTALEVVSHNQILVSGRKGRYFALATLSNGKKRDATHLVQWSVEPSSLASVEQGTGEVTASSPGNGEVVADLAALQSRLNLSVQSPASFGAILAVPHRVRLPVGASRPVRTYFSQLHADVSTSASWVSGNPNVATVVDGQIEARGAGQTTLTVQFGSAVSGVEVEVFDAPLASLRLSPSSLELAVGGQGRVRVEGITDQGDIVDLTDEAEWTLSQPDVAVVTSGNVFGLQQGSCELTASARSLTSPPLTLNVVTSPAPTGAYCFVDNRAPEGGDGSLNYPFNNLAEALRVAQLPGGIFLYRGDGSPRGLVGNVTLPDQMNLRGEGVGLESIGLGPGEHPELVGAIAVGNQTSLQGCSWNLVDSSRPLVANGVQNLTLENNRFVDKSRSSGPTFQLVNLEGHLRFEHNEIETSRITSAERVLDWQRTTAGSSEVTLDVNHNHFRTYGGIDIPVYIRNAQVAGPFPKMLLNCQDNQFIPTFFGIFYEYSGPDSELSFARNWQGDLRLRGATSLLRVIDCSPLNLEVFTLTAGEVTVTNNTVLNRLDVSAATGSLTPGIPEPTVRVDNNVVLRVPINLSDTTLQVVARATTLLVQGNQAGNGKVTFSSGQSGSKFGFRNNRIGRLDVTVQGGFTPGLRFCTAMSGNVGNFMQVLNSLSGTFELEGLSQLTSLNTYTTLFVAPGFVDVPVGSCGIPE